jgi:hypothetical protein
MDSGRLPGERLRRDSSNTLAIVVIGNAAQDESTAV